jgi:hypothetical protein
MSYSTLVRRAIISFMAERETDTSIDSNSNSTIPANERAKIDARAKRIVANIAPEALPLLDSLRKDLKDLPKSTDKGLLLHELRKIEAEIAQLHIRFENTVSRIEELKYHHR